MISQKQPLSKSVVKECPECNRRVLMDVKHDQLAPTTYCDCGELEVMQVVEQ
jgi:hypothetical protein